MGEVRKELERLTSDPSRPAPEWLPQVKAAMEHAMRTFMESPLGLTAAKMQASRGDLANSQIARDVLFIPEAVLIYGFGHVPAPWDPEGQHFKRLPSTPESNSLVTGMYLVRMAKAQLARREEFQIHPQIERAMQVWETHGRRAPNPLVVLDVLRRQLPIDTLWIELDPEDDIDGQVAEFKNWLILSKTRHLNLLRKRILPTRKAARDTLVFILRTTGMKTIDIAREVYPDRFSALTAPDLDDLIRTNLRRTRRSLKAAGVLPPSH